MPDSIQPHSPTTKTSPATDLAAAVTVIGAHLVHNDFVLAVSHTDYRYALGGTEKVLVEEQATLLERRISYIQIYPDLVVDRLDAQQAGDQPIGINVDSQSVESLSLTQFTLILQAMISRGTIRPLAVHLHHLLDFSQDGLGFLIESLGPIPVRFFVHDYYSICSSFNLLDHDNRYCGPESHNGDSCQGCQRCPDPVGHREGMRSLFNRIRPEVVAPSDVAGSIWTRYFPDLADRVRTVPHQIVEPLTAGSLHDHRPVAAHAEKIRIAYVGYEQVNKGLDTWWRLCDDKRIRRTYDLYHLGAAGHRLEGVTYVPVSFQDEGPDAMVDALVRHGIDVVLLWSIWPETYSFTFFEALAAGCYVITNVHSGNIRAQVEKWRCGKVFDSEAKMLQFLSADRSVRSALVNGHAPQRHRFRLRFNTELAETVMCKRATSPEQPTPAPIDPHWMDHWYRMVSGQSVSDRIKREELKRRAAEIHRIRAQLKVFRISRLHQLVERVRQWWLRHPNLSKHIRPVFIGCSQPFIHFFRR